MRTVEQIEEIRRAYYQGHKSIRAIAREHGHGREVIRAALAGAEPGPPRYRLRQPKRQPVRATIAPVVDAWLTADRAAPRKQRHTALRIYHRLVAEHGYTGSERTVRLCVQEWKRAHRDDTTGFVPLAYAPGAEAQCDWGDAVVRIGGVEQSACIFSIRLCYSLKPFVCAFPAARQECFFAAHEAAFALWGGVPRRITYDNLTSAVRKVLAGRNRVEQEAFVAFRGHHLFASHFCLPGRDGAHEKFTVEPVLGIITDVLGFRQFSLRGEAAVAGEWLLVCLAFNLKRFHTVSPAYGVKRSGGGHRPCGRASAAVSRLWPRCDHTRLRARHPSPPAVSRSHITIRFVLSDRLLGEEGRRRRQPDGGDPGPGDEPWQPGHGAHQRHPVPRAGGDLPAVPAPGLAARGQRPHQQCHRRTPNFPYYGFDFDVLYGAVDGQKFGVARPTVKARHARKYFGRGKGVAAYSLLCNHVPLNSSLIGAHEYEGHRFFDIWYRNTSDIVPTAITGDMHSVNRANVAILHWFGRRFEPRFTDLQTELKELYCADTPASYEKCLIRPVGQIDVQVIIDEKPHIDRIVAPLG